LETIKGTHQTIDANNHHEKYTEIQMDMTHDKRFNFEENRALQSKARFYNSKHKKQKQHYLTTILFIN